MLTEDASIADLFCLLFECIDLIILIFQRQRSEDHGQKEEQHFYVIFKREVQYCIIQRCHPLKLELKFCSILQVLITKID